MGILSGVLILMLAGGLVTSHMQTASAVGCAKKHKYDGVCDKDSSDITCEITSPPNHAIIHTGSAKSATVEFIVKASDTFDGVKKVTNHVTNDNQPTKVATLGGDGFYHATWHLVKASHTATAACSDFSANTAHNSISIIVKK